MRLLDGYLDYPVLVDVVAAVLLVALNAVLMHFGVQIVQYELDAIKDLLNELVSSSISLGGFVLTAMAIIASMRDNTPRLEEDAEPTSGKEYFFNSPAYHQLIRAFSWACRVYGGSFLWFCILRTAAVSMDLGILFHLTYFGLFVSLFTLFRCIFLVQSVVLIR
ncbi:MAG: hypothetical protein ACK4Q5_16560 [Saprospiraceae bacterium]